MTALKTALRIVALIILMSVVGYVLFFVNGQEPKADTAQVAVVTRTIQEQASSSPQISVEYPQFPTLSAAFNMAIEKSVKDRLAQFRQEAAENYKARKDTAPTDEHISMSDFSFIAKWQPAQINSKYVSFIIRFDSYTGGANENQQLETFNYSVEKKSTIGLSDLFPNSPDILEQVSTISVRDLTAHMKEAADTDVVVLPYKEGTAPTAENYKNFIFTKDTLTIYFAKYSVAAGAFGELHVDIPISDIK
jgi:hypothetical protein